MYVKNGGVFKTHTTNTKFTHQAIFFWNFDQLSSIFCIRPLEDFFWSWNV